jgi:hypothetical protein
MKFTTFIMRVWVIFFAAVIIFFAALDGWGLDIMLVIGIIATILLFLIFKLIDKFL